jgi:hypothetical protein
MNHPFNRDCYTQSNALLARAERAKHFGKSYIQYPCRQAPLFLDLMAEMRTFVRLQAVVVAAEGGRHELVRRRQMIGDLLAQDII